MGNSRGWMWQWYLLALQKPMLQRLSSGLGTLRICPPPFHHWLWFSDGGIILLDLSLSCTLLVEAAAAAAAAVSPFPEHVGGGVGLFLSSPHLHFLHPLLCFLPPLPGKTQQQHHSTVFHLTERYFFRLSEQYFLHCWCVCVFPSPLYPYLPVFRLSERYFLNSWCGGDLPFSYPFHTRANPMAASVHFLAEVLQFLTATNSRWQHHSPLSCWSVTIPYCHKQQMATSQSTFLLKCYNSLLSLTADGNITVHFLAEVLQFLTVTYSRWQHHSPLSCWSVTIPYCHLQQMAASQLTPGFVTSTRKIWEFFWVKNVVPTHTHA